MFNVPVHVLLTRAQSLQATNRCIAPHTVLKAACSWIQNDSYAAFHVGCIGKGALAFITYSGEMGPIAWVYGIFKLSESFEDDSISLTSQLKQFLSSKFWHALYSATLADIRSIRAHWEELNIITVNAHLFLKLKEFGHWTYHQTNLKTVFWPAFLSYIPPPVGPWYRI